MTRAALQPQVPTSHISGRALAAAMTAPNLLDAATGLDDRRRQSHDDTTRRTATVHSCWSDTIVSLVKGIGTAPTGNPGESSGGAATRYTWHHVRYTCLLHHVTYNRVKACDTPMVDTAH